MELHSQIVKGRVLKSRQYSLIGKSNDSLIRIAWSNPKSFSKAGMQLWIVREAWRTQWACSNVLFAMGWPFVQSGGREAMCSKTQCSSWFQVERERSKPKESHTIHSQLFSHTSFFCKSLLVTSPQFGNYLLYFLLNQMIGYLMVVSVSSLRMH